MAHHGMTGFAGSDDVFAGAVKRAREKRGMSQSDLAQEMRLRSFDFQQQTVHRIETNKRRVSVGEGIAISDILGVPIELMVDVDQASPRAQSMLLKSTANEALDVLAETAETLRQIRTQDMVAIRQYARERERAIDAFGDANEGAESARDLLGPLLRFQGANAFAVAWREMVDEDGFAAMLEWIGGYDVAETIDEYRGLV